MTYQQDYARTRPTRKWEKPGAEEGSASGGRLCLKCDKPFNSDGIANRLCSRCKRLADHAGFGGVQSYTSPTKKKR